MNASEKLEILLDFLGENINSFSIKIGQLRQTFYDIKKGKIKSFSPEVAKKIVSIFPIINKNWLIFSEGEMLNKDYLNNIVFSEKIESSIYNIEKSKNQFNKNSNNGKDNYYAIHDVNDKCVWTKTSKISGNDALNLISNYFAESQIAKLENGRIYLPKEQIEKYWEVEVVDNSMNEITNKILNKDWLLAKDIPRDKWRNKFEIFSSSLFYFLHNEKGHIIREINSYNINTGDIVLQSWNTNKELYPNIHINIKDCYIIAKIVRLINRNFIF